MGIISALALAWLLTLFDLDEVLTQGVNELLNTNFSTSIYWLAFFLVGVVIQIVQAFRGR